MRNRNFVTQAQIQRAKSVNLVAFMKAEYPNVATEEGKKHPTLRLKKHHNVVITENAYFEYPLQPGSKPNDGIDLMMNYMDMKFQDAVRTLCSYQDEVEAESATAGQERPFVNYDWNQMDLPF